MYLLPAIDLKDNKCVRLTKGDFATVEQVAKNALATAQNFEAAGAEWIHMVDLDGAKDGHPVNHATIIEVADNTSLKVEVGGGIRTMDDIEFYLERGIYRVILGSVALRNPDLVKDAIQRYGEKIVVGIDAKNGEVKASGWLEGSRVNYLDLAEAMVEAGVKTIIFTDIDKDGTMSGPNFDQLKKLNTTVDIDIIASGGIRSIEDLEQLSAMGIAGAILGKSIYQGTIELVEAINSVS